MHHSSSWSWSCSFMSLSNRLNVCPFRCIYYSSYRATLYAKRSNIQGTQVLCVLARRKTLLQVEAQLEMCVGTEAQQMGICTFSFIYNIGDSAFTLILVYFLRIGTSIFFMTRLLTAGADLLNGRALFHSPLLRFGLQNAGRAGTVVTGSIDTFDSTMHTGLPPLCAPAPSSESMESELHCEVQIAPQWNGRFAQR